MKISRQTLQIVAGSMLVAMTAVSLSSCGGDDTLSGAGGSLQASQAAAVAGMFMTGSMGLNLNLKPTESPSLAQLGISGFSAGASVGTSVADPLANCTTITPSTVVDADSDGIAKEKNYVYDCNDILLLDGFNVKSVGKISVKDYDDTKGHLEGGYRYEMEYQGASQKLPDYDTTYSHKGFFDGRRMGNSYVYQSEFTAGFAGSERGDKYDLKWRSNYSTTYTPEDLNDLWGAGRVQFAGYFGVEGRVNGQDFAEFNVAWELSTQDLVYDWANCNVFKSGKMFWTDGSGQRFEVQYNCSNYKMYFQGQEIQPE